MDASSAKSGVPPRAPVGREGGASDTTGAVGVRPGARPAAVRAAGPTEASPTLVFAAAGSMNPSSGLEFERSAAPSMEKGMDGDDAMCSAEGPRVSDGDIWLGGIAPLRPPLPMGEPLVL